MADTSRQRLRRALEHRGDSVPFDFGATAVTGIHVSIVEGLRAYFDLAEQPVKVIEPYQMLGAVDDELARYLHVDTVGVSARNTLFGFPNQGWKEWRTPWNQEVLVPERFNTTTAVDGSTLIYPEGDTSVPASGRLPAGGYFFDSIVRQEPVDDDKLSVEDNMEEFAPISEEDLDYFRRCAEELEDDPRGRIFNFGGTGLGDIALVPAPFLAHPKGVRDVEEWYISLVARRDFVEEIFDRQSAIAVENLKRLYPLVGETPDVVYICGTDFGTQTSSFCSVETFNELWAPYYRRINDWIHENTGWKTFKHSCGAVEPFIESFADCGFDVLNPVQITATGMDPSHLVKTYGKHIVFWGGGVDPQHTLPFGTPTEVQAQVRRNVEALSGAGGYVFNAIHNVQAKTPIENVVAMIEAAAEYR